MRRGSDRRPMEVGAWFTAAAAGALRTAIAEASGQEVFCVGNCDADGLVRTVTIAARGNHREVPVLAPYVDGADVLIHNHPSGLLQPSAADLAVAGWVGDQGKGFCIVDNAVTRIYVVAEPAPRRDRRLLDTRQLAATLRAGGALHRLHPGFEQRSGQISLLQAACDAFNDEVIVAAEAGTGIGKSLAYLIPAVAWADANDERVVVSTATINLQQQLMAHDLPLVQRILGTEVKSCLVKGRGNYLCLRRLREVHADAQGLAPASDSALDAAAAGEVRAIYEWSLASPTGSRSDVPFQTDAATWDLVCSEGDACNALRCPDREACFVLRARREAAAARLLVVNHHLLFADLAIRLAGGGREPLASAAVLPGFSRIVFDEAHAIESNAASLFSQRLARTGLERLAGRLVSARHGGSRGGRLGGSRGLVPRRSAWFISAGREVRSVVAQVEELRRLAGRLERAAAQQLAGEPAAVLEMPGDGMLVEVLDAVRAVLASLAGAVSAALDAAEPAERDDADAVELRIQARRMRAAAQLCERLSTVSARSDSPVTGNVVRWVEAVRRRDGRAAARLVVTPVDVAPLMRAAIFDRYPSVVLTSATLTVAGDFAFWCGRVGLSEVTSRPVFTEQYPSPFAYREQAMVGIPIDAPEPGAAEHQAWLGRYLIAVLRASRGRALVLFTSYAMLDRSFRQVQEPLAAEGITVMRQGDDDRHRLLDRFRGDTASVLLATDSFWEGIDAPGEALSLVVICRLPFSVPSHPVAAAQMARVAESGADPFFALTLPRAVMRVRQGFGRLIRRHDDRGVVLFLDARLARKSYGGAFLQSLPDVQLETVPGADLVDRVRDYLAR